MSTPRIALLIVLLAGLGAGATIRVAPVSAGQATTVAAPDLTTAFIRVADRISPSVVSIRSVRRITSDAAGQGQGGLLPSPFGNSPFEDFFRRMEPFQAPGGRGGPGGQDGQSPGRQFMQQGQGSGVIVSADGLILTNSHVVRDAEEVTVVLADDRQYTAEVIGSDDRTDLAVIRIDEEGLREAELGDSDALKVGQWVVAAGNPFGLSSSITAGIVSATGRSRVGVADYEDFIQTDAAINPGNSGGPLVDLDGRVVGINTAIFSRGGGNNGIGFSIPIDMARSVMEDLIEEGRVVRGYLGVVIQELTEGMARSFGYEGTDGALVAQVTDDGPAAEAGLQPGDIITRLDGDPVTTIDQFRLAVAEVDPGTTVELRVFRDGRTSTLEVRIAELPTGSSSVARSDAESPDVNLGMTGRALTPDIAARLGMDESISGVVITQLEPLGPAARAGLQVRDVITQVQGAPIVTMEDLRRELRRHDLEQGVRLTVQSQTGRRFAFLRLRE